MKIHYQLNDIDNALNKLPIEKGSTVFLHSNIGFFGNLDGVNDPDLISNIFYEKIMDKLGHNGTIVVPAFTYSFPRNELFDPSLPILSMGVFSNFIRKNPNSYRSLDPCYSVCAIGKLAKKMTINASENSFDNTSFFARFLNANGIILNLNFDAGSTFLHYIERKLSVPYRYDKTFKGHIIQNEKKKLIKSTIYVRDINSDQTKPRFENFTLLVTEKKLFKTTILGRGQIGCINAIDCQLVLKETLPKRPWLLTEADISGNPPLL